MKRDMTFKLEKSSLLHFYKARAPRTKTVKLGPITIALREAERFLGIILDRKLRFMAYLRHVTNRLRT